MATSASADRKLQTLLHRLQAPCGLRLTCGHLVSEASAAAVDHHAHLPSVVDAHLLGSVVVVDLVHHLDLGVVVSSSQSPQLQPQRSGISLDGSGGTRTGPGQDQDPPQLPEDGPAPAAT